MRFLDNFQYKLLSLLILILCLLIEKTEGIRETKSRYPKPTTATGKQRKEYQTSRIVNQNRKTSKNVLIPKLVVALL